MVLLDTRIVRTDREAQTVQLIVRSYCINTLLLLTRLPEKLKGGPRIPLASSFLGGPKSVSRVRSVTANAVNLPPEAKHSRG